MYPTHHYHLHVHEEKFRDERFKNLGRFEGHQNYKYTNITLGPTMYVDMRKRERAICRKESLEFWNPDK